MVNTLTFNESSTKTNLFCFLTSLWNRLFLTITKTKSTTNGIWLKIGLDHFDQLRTIHFNDGCKILLFESRKPNTYLYIGQHNRQEDYHKFLPERPSLYPRKNIDEILGKKISESLTSFSGFAMNSSILATAILQRTHVSLPSCCCPESESSDLNPTSIGIGPKTGSGFGSLFSKDKHFTSLKNNKNHIILQWNKMKRKSLHKIKLI